MKKIVLTMVMAITLMFVFSSCGDKVTLESDCVKIDGIYVDDSFVDQEGKAGKLLYLFYTVTPNEEENISSKSVSIVAGETKLSCDNYKETKNGHPGYDVGRYTPSYHYSDYIETVAAGDSLKVMSTYKISDKVLNDAESYKLDSSDIDGAKDILFTNEEIKHMDGIEKIAEDICPDDYKKESEKRKKASASEEAKVSRHLVDYYWEFVTYGSTNRIEFSSGNKYTLKSALGTTEGSFVIEKGYIKVTNGIGVVTEIPYYFENNDLYLELNDAYDPKA